MNNPYNGISKKIFSVIKPAKKKTPKIISIIINKQTEIEIYRLLKSWYSSSVSLVLLTGKMPSAAIDKIGPVKKSTLKNKLIFPNSLGCMRRIRISDAKKFKALEAAVNVK